MEIKLFPVSLVSPFCTTTHCQCAMLMSPWVYPGSHSTAVISAVFLKPIKLLSKTISSGEALQSPCCSFSLGHSDQSNAGNKLLQQLIISDKTISQYGNTKRKC